MTTKGANPMTTAATTDLAACLALVEPGKNGIYSYCSAEVASAAAALFHHHGYTLQRALALLAAVESGTIFHCKEGAAGTAKRLRRWAGERYTKDALKGQTMEEAAMIIEAMLASAPAAPGVEG